MTREDVDVAYSTIRLHSRKSLTQAFSNVFWLVVFALRSKREIVCVSNHVSHRKLLAVLVHCCLLL